MFLMRFYCSHFHSFSVKIELLIVLKMQIIDSHCNQLSSINTLTGFKTNNRCLLQQSLRASSLARLTSHLVLICQLTFFSLPPASAEQIEKKKSLKLVPATSFIYKD